MKNLTFQFNKRNFSTQKQLNSQISQNLRTSKIQKKTLCIKRKKKIKEFPTKTIKEMKNGQIIQAKKLFQT